MKIRALSVPSGFMPSWFMPSWFMPSWFMPSLLLLAVSSFGAATGCRGPRDVELDQRVAVARVAVGAAAAAPSVAPPKSAATPERSSKAAPRKGVIDLRTYSDNDIKEILGKVTGSGAELKARLTTTRGDILCTLFADDSPQTVANFVALATGQRSWRHPDTQKLQTEPFYNGLTFHRVISNFIAQTGNPGRSRNGGPGWTIVRETGPAKAYDTAGTMGAVDSGDESHGSMFFITAVPYRNHQGKYSPFGHCDNPELVKSLANGETHPATDGEKRGYRPKAPVTIERVTIIRE